MLPARLRVPLTLASYRTRRALLVLLHTCLPAMMVLAETNSWHQWRGPQRDGHAAPQSLLKEWPSGGPKMVWEYKNLGMGFSTCSLAAGRLYTMGARDQACFVVCLDAKTGQLLWEKSIDGVAGDSDYNTGWGVGPRSTPTVVGEHLFALSDLGKLVCLKSTSGDVVWSVDLVKDFGGKVPKWGYSESVLVDGDRVIVMPGGKNFLVGLDAKTGKQVWGSKGIEMSAHYVSAIKSNIGGVDMYITASEKGLLGIDAKSGELLFQNDSTANGTAVIPTPIVSGNIIYHVSAYGAGNCAVKVKVENGKVDAEQLYHHKTKSMENHHGGVILHDKAIFGFSKTDRGVWMAQDLESGEVLWSQKIGSNTSGSVAFADGMLYCYNDKDGTCYLVEASREGWKAKGELSLPEQTKIERGKGAIWAHPIISDGMLFIRDQDLLFAYAIAR
jgi:outer membrane protein assembly factor BamB